MIKLIAFWVALVLGINWALAAVRTIADPEWYYSKRLQAGLPIPESTTGFLVIKVAQCVFCALFVQVVGEELGYW